MSSPPQNKTCGICMKIAATGQGQAIFSAECSHSFHFGCIFSQANNLCPICHTKWNLLPLTFPTTINHNNIFNNIPFQSAFEPSFSDDEPLPATTPNPPSSAASQKLTIKAIPESPAIAASESVSTFTVLVRLKAPSLSDDPRLLRHRAPIDLVTVLDVSGSMCGSKLALLKRAVYFVIDNLGPSDRLSIVSFANHANRILPLIRMTENGQENAKKAVNSLIASGGTNIVDGLKNGVKVLEERRQRNPVTNIIFLSDGNDTCNHSSLFQTFSYSRQAPQYLNLLPASICPRNRRLEDVGEIQIFPVHSFGFGSDHDPVSMHAISDASGGTFSFIESYEMVQDAFAGCIGGLLSVVSQELRLTLRSASHGVEIKSIPSGRYKSEISNKGSQGLISVGELYADEEKEFLINLSIPPLPDNEVSEKNERKTSLLDITCSYRDVVSRERVQIEADLVEIRRPKSLSPHDYIVNLEVDRQRNRLRAAETIAQAQEMAEIGNLGGAQSLLAKRRSDLMASASAQAGDGLVMWLEADLKETERRMGNEEIYARAGRAFALAGISSHAAQRATTRGEKVAGAAHCDSLFGAVASSAAPAVAFSAYATPNMANMVCKSQQLNKKGEKNTAEKEDHCL